MLSEQERSKSFRLVTELFKHLKMPLGLQREATTVRDTDIHFIDLQVCELFFSSN